jgi:hypothetical protein
MKYFKTLNKIDIDFKIIHIRTQLALMYFHRKAGSLLKAIAFRDLISLMVTRSLVFSKRGLKILRNLKKFNHLQT